MKIKKIDGKSRNPQKELGELLKKNFPEIFTEQKIDCQKLKRTLGEDVEANGERYGLSWAGKGDCFRHIQEPTTKTLKPAKDESVDFENTGNLFIEGENLEVLKVLQKSYYGKIKAIYIDPPYNTGNDSFIYPDRFQESQDEYLRRIGDKDEEGNLTKEGMFRKNTKDSGHYHSNWLSMMYPRLFLARNLLRQDGVIFVSIDDNEVHNLRMMMNEIFGEENFIGQLIWNKQHSQQQGLFKNYHEYVVVYARNNETQSNISGGDGEIIAGALKKISRANPASEFEFPAGTRVEAPDGTEFSGTYGNSEKVSVVKGKFIVSDGKLVEPVALVAGWTQKEQMKKWFAGLETIDTKGQNVLEFFFNSEGKLKCRKDRSKLTPPTTLPLFGMVSEQTEALKALLGGYYFENPKPVEMIKLFCSWFTKDEDIILDFFSGSGTTAHSVMAQNAEDGENRKFICVQLAEACKEDSEAFKAGYKTIADIAKERIKRAGAKIKKENGSKLNFENKKIDSGFKVFKLDDSNFKIWNGNVKDPEELEKQMLEFVDNVKKESTAENMLFELLLKSGLDPDVSVEKKKSNGGSYYSVDGGKLIVHLEGKISKELVEDILKAKPEKMICLDRAFGGNDQLKTNTALSMESAKSDFRVV